jgi:hypothetical protein
LTPRHIARYFPASPHDEEEFARILLRSKKALAVLAAALSLTMFTASSAFANWSSYIVAWTDGNESRHWDDQGTYSQIMFEGCSAQYATTNSVVIQMWHYYSILPNESLGSKTFTACFNSSTSWSNGEWTNIPSGDNTLFFEASKVAQGNSCCLLNVAEVDVDTSEAD